MTDEEPPTAWAERATFYRCRALDALKEAGLASDARRRNQYFQMAQSWYALAVQIENQMDHLRTDEATSTLISPKRAADTRAGA